MAISDEDRLKFEKSHGLNLDEEMQKMLKANGEDLNNETNP